MDRKKMIKKHLITCSVMLVMAVIFTLNICSTTDVKTAVKIAPAPKFIFTNNDAETHFCFANEAVPENNKAVNHKMQTSLAEHDFKNIQSNVLHMKAQRLFPVIEPIL